MCVCSDGCFRWTFGGSLVRNVRFADFDIVTCEFLRKSRLLEEVSYETLVLET